MRNSNNLALKYPNTHQEIETNDSFFDELDMQLDSLFQNVIPSESIILPPARIIPQDLDNLVESLFDQIIVKGVK